MLAIPPKRTEKNLVTYLTDPEVDALLAARDQATWTGRRDHAMLALTIQTGLRISELTGLVCQDITLGTGANVHTIGKGPKERRTPLTPPTKTMLNAWLRERAGGPEDPLFPTITGKRLSRDAMSNCQMLWMTWREDAQAATLSSVVVASSSVTFAPSLNSTPSSSSLTSSAPLSRRHRSWAESSSL